MTYGNTNSESDIRLRIQIHDCQIESVKRQRNSSLNQSNRTQDAHLLCIDEEKCSNDEDLQEVIRTLKGAVSDAGICRCMDA